jgi:hypothetical protein
MDVTIDGISSVHRDNLQQPNTGWPSSGSRSLTGIQGCGVIVIS